MIDKFYQLTSYEFSRLVLDKLALLPKVEFSEVKPGMTLLYEDYNYKTIYSVNKVTPSCKFLEVSLYPKKDLFKLSKKGISKPFILLDTQFISFLGISHRDLIEGAVKGKLPIPAKVKIEYPELFVEIPGRFKKERLRNFLSYGTRLNYANEEVTLKCIAYEHNSIQNLMEERAKAIVYNPAVEQDYDKYIDNAKTSIDFYRWVLPLVSKDGVFYIND